MYDGPLDANEHARAAAAAGLFITSNWVMVCMVAKGFPDDPLEAFISIYLLFLVQLALLIADSCSDKGVSSQVAGLFGFMRADEDSLNSLESVPYCH